MERLTADTMAPPLDYLGDPHDHHRHLDHNHHHEEEDQQSEAMPHTHHHQHHHQHTDVDQNDTNPAVGVNTGKDSNSDNSRLSRRLHHSGLASTVVRWPPRAAVVFGVLVLSLLLSAQSSGGVSALSCPPCDLNQCPNVTDCKGGLVMGICWCCQVCAHVEDESCGGPFGILGRCDKDLVCVISQENRQNPVGVEEGVCKKLTDLKPSPCPPDSYRALSSPSSSSTSYPGDLSAPSSHGGSGGSGGSPSNLISDTETSSEDHNQPSLLSDDLTVEENNHPSPLSDVAGDEHNQPAFLSDSPIGEENPTSNVLDEHSHSTICVCNFSICKIPSCEPGYDLRLLENATGFPGACCEVYECQRPDGCQSVMCPPYVENLCPPDSILKAPVWTEDGCCEIQQGCECPSEEECEPVKCPVGFQVQVISRASRQPGSCCDKFRCVNESGLTCTYNGQELQNGQTWNIDKCKTCVCRDGLNRCSDKSCPKVSCTWMVIPEGDCCPVCRGCAADSGELYNNGVTWKENDCTTCTCEEGHARCQSEFCEVHCANPRRVKGRCCPVCPEPCHLDCQFGLKKDPEGQEICECAGADDMCPHWDPEECDKKCEYGYKRNRDGCIKCKCNKCPQFNCTKRCTHGHILNDEGCALCKCKELPVPELINSNVEPINSNVEPVDLLPSTSCMSRQGARHENGESWNDGCRECYCHKGVEMCSLIACPAPHCLNPVFRVGDCCPSCPGLTIVSPNGQKELCQSSMGHYYVEGETWPMDQCTHCVCHGGAILCETQTCPPVLCHHPVRHENQCCAICRVEEVSLVPTSSYRNHCKSTTGMLYKHGEVWQSTPCQSCSCQDGQIHCYNQMCPLVNCNKTVLRKGQCCPTCVNDVSKPKLCVYKGMTYDKGEKWEGDNCTQCMCVDGKTECFPSSCPALHCSVLIQRKGECCPECYDVSKSHNHGSSHLINTTVSSIPRGSQSDNTESVAGYIVLGILVFGLAVVILILVFCMMKRSQRSNSHRRPKSTNVELQGHMPFITDCQPKNVNIMEKEYLEKLYPGIASEKGKGDRASNHYTEMVFGDQNKETMANGHFLAHKT